MSLLKIFNIDRSIEQVYNPKSFIKPTMIKNVYKRIFVNSISKISLVSEFVPSGNKARQEDDRTEEEKISIFEIELTNHKDYLLICKIIFSIILHPVILILKHKNKCRLCACKTRENKLDANANVVGVPAFSSWTYFDETVDPVEGLLRTVSMEKFEGGDAQELCSYIHSRLEFYNDSLLSSNQVCSLLLFLDEDAKQDGTIENCMDTCSITPKYYYVLGQSGNRIYSYQKSESGYDENEVWNFLCSNAEMREALKEKNIFEMDDLIELHSDQV